MTRPLMFWFWVFVAPAAVLTALGTVGDTFEIAWRFWWVSGPVLLAWGAVVWRWLRPEAPAAGQGIVGVVERVVMTVAIVAFTIAILGLLIAFVMWAKWYLLLASPLYLGFGGWVLWGLWQDRRKAALKRPKVVRGAGPGDGSRMVR